MSSKAKRKGTRVENEIVKLFQAEGFNARRQPLSGAIQAFPHDVQVMDLFDLLDCKTNEEIRIWLLQEAGVAVVPFQAFGLEADTGWFRISIGAVSLEDIGAAMDRLESALKIANDHERDA